jgi:hypothetical protein
MFKNNWRKFERVIQAEHINSLYHFTDQKNWESIQQEGGLYSWYSCEEKGIKIKRPGGGNLSRRLDLSKGLEDYVRLSFVKDHPMMYIAKKEGRIKKPLLLYVDPEVITLKGTRFSRVNATRNGASKGKSIKQFKKIRFDLLKSSYFNLDYSKRPFYQAEVMVKTFLPIEYVKKVRRIRI